MDLKIHCVGMRDGLQMEKQLVPFEKKVEWIEKLIQSGVDIIQIGSFVHPVKMPQMADTDKLFEYFNSKPKRSNLIFSGLVLNEKGLERGMKVGVEMFCMGVSASETHSQKNTGMTVADATKRITAMAKEAIAAGKKVQVSVQSAFGCGFEGKVEDNQVLNIVRQFLDAGLKNISLADTAGHANPEQVKRLYSDILNMATDVELTAHFHNTYGMGITNCYAAMNLGVKNFETAFGGLGGCPFTKMAAGNVATEDFVHTLQKMGIRQDINLNDLIELSKDVSNFFGRELPGFVYKTGGIKY